MPTPGGILLEWIGEAEADARLLKECLHELGHTFGLVHCADTTCVMHRSNSLLDVDKKTARFCPDCRRRLWKRVPQGSAR